MRTCEKLLHGSFEQPSILAHPLCHHSISWKPACNPIRDVEICRGLLEGCRTCLSPSLSTIRYSALTQPLSSYHERNSCWLGWLWHTVPGSAWGNLKCAHEPQVIRQLEPLHRLTQHQLSLHRLGCPKEVVDALRRVRESLRICTACKTFSQSCRNHKKCHMLSHLLAQRQASA